MVAKDNSQDGHDDTTPGLCVDLDALRQRSEQYFTFSQSRAHFLRHTNGLPQTMHIFSGKSAL